MILHLPPPRRGGSFLATLGHYSKPIIKRLLKTGTRAAIGKLKTIAANKIRNGGDILSRLATAGARGGGRRGGRGEG